MTTRLRLATRGSPLARAQADAVAARLAATGIEADLVVVVTEGDRRSDVALAELAGRGVFTTEVQAAVLDGRADVAVHSAKDLPAATPDGLVLAAVPERRDPADAIVGRPLSVLPPGATVATGAPRRKALLLTARPDLSITAVRGNIETRLNTVGSRGIDAVIVAVAALERLALADRIAERLDPSWFVPQVGQGAIALECRAGSGIEPLLAAIDDDDAHRALRCERAFLDELGVGCEVPGGAHAWLDAGRITVRGVLLSDDGHRAARGTEHDADEVRAGRALAVRLRDEMAAGASPR